MDLHITQEAAGHTAAGLPLSIFTLGNRNGMCVRLATLGAAIAGLRLPDRHGRLAELVQARGDYGAGLHLLPSPAHALHRSAWHAVPLVSDLTVGVRLVSPGPLAVLANYTLDDANQLALAFESAAAAPATLGLRLAVNLAGEGAASGHLLSVRSSRCVPAGQAEQAVAGSSWDCRSLRLLRELPGQVRYLLDEGAEPAVRLADPDSGRLLEILGDAGSLRVGWCEAPEAVLLEPRAGAGAGRLVFRFSVQA